MPAAYRPVLTMLLVELLACGGGDGQGTVVDAGGLADAAGSPGQARDCKLPCVGPADCATSDPAFDEDHFACPDGVCVYLGCRGDECGAGYICQPSPSGFSKCLRQCDAPGDCATGSDGPYAASHWECRDHACDYLGCFQDSDCTALAPGLACPPASAGEVRLCTSACVDPGDCPSSPLAPFDGDNWTCEAGFCAWLGCLSTDECQDVGADLVCT